MKEVLIMPSVALNEDSTHYFITREGREREQLIRQLEAWVHQYADTAVDELVLNVNAMRTSYDSQVWEPLWKGYDPQQGEDQPFFAGATEYKTNMYRLVASCWEHHRLGVDVFERAVALARQRGIRPRLSMRMNDVHFVHSEKHFIHSRFWRENPQFRRVPGRVSGTRNSTDAALDYGRQEVREYHLALIRELAERYDFDGLELDWMRFGYHFRPGFEAQGAALLTEFTAEVRKLLDHWAEVRGHGISLSARVPARPQTAVDLGMDAAAWAQQGLVDLLVVTPFWETADTDMPIGMWKRLLRGTEVKLAAGLEVLLRPSPDYDREQLLNSLESVRGMATSYLHQGVDQIYLFNYMDDYNFFPCIADMENYSALLREVGSLETMKGKPRRHILTYPDTWAVGERKAARLPVLCKPNEHHAFRIPIGPKPDGMTAFVVIGASGDGTPEDLAITVNGEMCRLGECPLLPPLPWEPRFAFEIPRQALHDGCQVIELFSALEWKVTWVEIAVR